MQIEHISWIYCLFFLCTAGLVAAEFVCIIKNITFTISSLDNHPIPKQTATSLRNVATRIVTLTTSTICNFAVSQDKYKTQKSFSTICTKKIKAISQNKVNSLNNK